MTSPEPDSDDQRQPTLIDPARALTEEAVRQAPRAPHVHQPVTAGLVIADRYELRERLGVGATAEVWTGLDRQLDRLVAVKLLLPDWRGHSDAAERFRREGRMTAKLTHHGIVSVLDAGLEPDGTAFHVMELVQGESLADALDRRGRLTPEEVVDLGAAVLDALSHAHAAGLVHRDVKPGNILLDGRDGTPKLTDFGVAKVEHGDRDLTSTGMIIGTAAYLAPEQATGEALDGRADQYALGCVLFECLTGQRAFDGATPVQIAGARIGVQIRPSDRDPSVPPGLDAVIARSMAPEPAGRFPTAEAMADALRTSLDQPAPALHDTRPSAAHQSTAALPAMSSTPAQPPADGVGGSQSAFAERPSRPRRGGRSMIAVVAAAVLVAVAALLAIGLAGGQDTSDDGVGDADAGSSGETPVAVASATGFDPQGDGGEYDEDAPLLLDGDPATTWRTEGYNSASFGNLKSGVGVTLQLAEPTDLSAVRLFGVTPGITAEVRVSADRPSSLEDTTLVGTADGGGDVEVTLEGAEGVGWVTIWIVPPLPSDGGRHRAEIGEVQPIR
ncbi:protein kinase domain-containing protein [Euzebya rosea]|uniref:protein kinase domain-containing protein n=1 Tax=Euzebya rosea TaxID=2052804 RepID=UPI000D3E853C|nr:protein kinase [Euzebya rosea]